MSPLFGKKEEKAEQTAVAQAEAARLEALTVPDLAAGVMAAFGDDGPRPSTGAGGINILQVSSWMLASFPHGATYLEEIGEPVREALQLLENSGLVLAASHGGAGRWYSATRLGEAALADGTVKRHLEGAPSA